MNEPLPEARGRKQKPIGKTESKACAAKAEDQLHQVQCETTRASNHRSKRSLPVKPERASTGRKRCVVFCENQPIGTLKAETFWMVFLGGPKEGAGLLDRTFLSPPFYTCSLSFAFLTPFAAWDQLHPKPGKFKIFQLYPPHN